MKKKNPYRFSGVEILEKYVVSDILKKNDVEVVVIDRCSIVLCCYHRNMGLRRMLNFLLEVSLDVCKFLKRV